MHIPTSYTVSPEEIWTQEILFWLWNEILESGEYIHDEYTLKYHYFEWNFEYDEMEEFMEERGFFTYYGRDITVPYDVWKSKKGYYIYFLVPAKYEAMTEGISNKTYKISDFPANLNQEIEEKVREIL